MASEALIKNGTNQLLFANHDDDFGSAPATPANSLIKGTPVDIQIDLTGVIATSGAWQSAKSATLGTTRTPIYRVDACIEFAVAPSDGDTVDFYWAGSPASGVGVGNGGGVTGTDLTYSPTSGTLAELTYIGSLICRANVICIGAVGNLHPQHEYGSLVVLNKADQAFAAAADEIHITFTEVIPEAQ